MGFVLRMPEAGRSTALTKMYAVHESARGLGIIGESLLHQNAQGELIPAEQCISPAVAFCGDVMRSLEHPKSTMRDAFRVAHEPNPIPTDNKIHRAVIGAAALAVNGSLQWGVIGGGVAILSREDASILFITPDDREPGDALTQAQMHKQRWDNPDEFASINGDPRMIGRERIGSAGINPSLHQVAVFSEQSRPLLADEAMRVLLLQASAGRVSEATVREYVTKGRNAHRFPEGAMRLIVLEAVSRQRQPHYDRGYTGNSRQPLGWNVQQTLQTWAAEAE